MDVIPLKEESDDDGHKRTFTIYIYIYYMHIKDIGVAASSTLSDTTRWHSQTFA